jgi:hypothetical protein
MAYDTFEHLFMARFRFVYRQYFYSPAEMLSLSWNDEAGESIDTGSSMYGRSRFSCRAGLCVVLAYFRL